MKPVLVLSLTLTPMIAGCTGFNFERLAPPGIIRYERIADQKEPNPAIVAELEAYEADKKAKFPKIGETAAGKANVERASLGAVEAQIKTLEEARDELQEGVESDQRAAQRDAEAAIESDSDDTQ